jgi:hypothetical protein
MLPATVALSAMLWGCGSTPAPPAATASKPPAAKATAKVTVTTTSKEDPEAALLAKLKDDQPRAAILTFSDARRRGNLAPRTQVEPEAFRIKDLPLVDIPEPLSASKAPRELPAGEEAKELFIDWRGVEASRVGSTWTTVRVSLQGEPLGRVKIGGNEAAVSGKDGKGGGGGVYVTCGGGERSPGAAVIAPARWETLTLGGDKRRSAVYTVVDGWFDARTCKAVVVRRTVVQPRPLPGGVLFGFRDECAQPTAPPEPSSAKSKSGTDEPTATSDKCAGMSITLLGPRLSHVVANAVGGDVRTALGSFSRVTIPLRRGGGGSLVERVPADALRDWLGPASSSLPTGDLTLGVEVVQTVDDPEPIAVSYVSNDAR